MGKLPSLINPEDAKNLIHDDIQDYRKSSPKTKDIIAIGIFIAGFILCLTLFLIINNSFRTATETVATIASSVTGVLEGTAEAPQAYVDGKTAGLSAEDTKASVETEFSNVGKLEVLVSGVTVTNLHEYSDIYAGLYVSKGYAVFTVDLSNAEIEVDDANVNVIVNDPECSVYIDELSTRKLAEWSHVIWNGAEEDGYFAYLNSWNKTKEELENSIDEYDTLFELAKESAEKQISTLLGSIHASSKTINVTFKGADNE